MNINQEKLGQVIRFVSGTLVNLRLRITRNTNYLLCELQILSLRIFIQTTLSLTEFDVVFVLLSLNQIKKCFPTEEIDFLLLTRFTNLVIHNN